MTFLSCLTDQDKVIVLDASVVINLLATGHARNILRALNTSLVVTGNVVREIEQGALTGRQEPQLLTDLINADIVQMEELTSSHLEHFFKLVSGSTVDSLGDGEAATLAYAHCNNFSAAIDERKATRISGERFQAMKLVTTVDILAHESVRNLLGDEGLASATLQSLKKAKMQVRAHQLDWVTQLIGEANLMVCPSLKRLAGRHVRAPEPVAGVDR